MAAFAVAVVPGIASRVLVAVVAGSAVAAPAASTRQALQALVVAALLLVPARAVVAQQAVHSSECRSWHIQGFPGLQAAGRSTQGSIVRSSRNSYTSCTASGFTAGSILCRAPFEKL